MDFTVDRLALLSELAIAQGAAEIKITTMPVLGNFRVVAGDGLVSIHATNLQLGFTAQVPADVKEPGEALVPALQLYNRFAKAPSDQVRVKLDGTRIRVLAGRNKCSIDITATDKFPVLPEKLEPVAKIPISFLSSALRRVAFAVSREDNRFLLTCALISISADKITVVGLDEHRLAVVTTPADFPAIKSPVKILLPRPAISEILAATANAATDTVVDVCFNKGHVYVVFGNKELYSRSVEGKFPAYDLVFPKGEQFSVGVSAEVLRDALDRVADFADDRCKKVDLHLSDNLLTIKARTSFKGESDEELDVEYVGPDMVFAVNASYLIDFLRLSGSEKVKLFVTGPDAAVEMRIDGQDDYRYVVATMHLEGIKQAA